jgi:CubicO group peptidase (beta-lactamase class C family)
MSSTHDVLARHVESGAVPGLVALAARGGEVRVHALGQTELRGGAPTRRDTIFRVASMTKPVVAAAALILVEECRLRLDEPLDELLPELAGRRVLRSIDAELDDTVPAERPLTLRDLLTFRMGLGAVMAPPDAYPIQRAAGGLFIPTGPPDPTAAPPPDEWLRRLGELPLVHQPGETWMYHTGSDVLGVLVARASGQSLEGFLRERVFEPLGMRDTGFSVPPEQIGRLATSYATDPESGELTLFDAPGGGWSRPPAFPSGGGGLVSTADDYLAFASMLLAGGGGILSRASVELMTTDQLTPAQKASAHFPPGYFESRGWGFGVSVVTRRDDFASVGSYGWDGGLGTSWANDPREGLVLVLLTQASWTSPVPPRVRRDFWTSTYAAIDEFPPPAPS